MPSINLLITKGYINMLNNMLNNNEANTKQRFRDAAEQMLSSEHNRYHLTISPKPGMAIDFLISSFNHLMKLLNEALYGKRYRNKNQYIHGMVVLELSDSYNPHFHLIIRDPHGDLENRYSLKEALRWVIPKIKTRRLIGSNSNTKQLIGSNSYHLQEYYCDSDGDHYILEEYLTKELMQYGTREKLDNFSTLNIDGAEFGIRDRRNYH